MCYTATLSSGEGGVSERICSWSSNELLLLHQSITVCCTYVLWQYVHISCQLPHTMHSAAFDGLQDLVLCSHRSYWASLLLRTEIMGRNSKQPRAYNNGVYYIWNIRGFT